MRGRLDEVLVAREPWIYATLRVGYGITLVTHGLPKLLGLPHGSMADPMAASVRLISGTLGLPFAMQIGLAIALLEGVGGALMAIGLATRPLAVLFSLQMVGICIALAPTYPWIDRGIEYPIMLGLVGLAIAARGGDRLSADRLLSGSAAISDQVKRRRSNVPFANFKVPEAALSRAQKEEIVHRVTDMLAEYFSEAARPHTMVLIEEVKDGGYARADQVYMIPEAYRATN